MSWQAPTDHRKRPVVVLGAGVLGRRIACSWAAGGWDVHVRDPSAEQRAQCVQYVDETIAAYKALTKAATAGTVQAFEDLEPAVANAWLVVEAVPEKLALKISTFATLEQLAPSDCILATNSSSYKSSEMISEVSDETKRRVLNTHYYMPPKNMVVELMTDGVTDDEVISFLTEQLRETGAKPYVARKESTGFIFNRLWAAVKRETLMILSEGVSDAAEIDSIWTEMFVKAGAKPCATMDQVGLDTVAFIEGHYIAERGLPSTHTTDFLKANYLDQGKLGNKSDKGGLYPPKPTPASPPPADPSLLILDVGLSATNPTDGAGAILRLSTDGSPPVPLITNQELPDGIAIDHALGRIFWTCMGTPGARDGTLHSAALDGSNALTLLGPGTINTPKQLALDTEAQQIYFSDREGCAVHRCAYDGTGLETLISNPPAQTADAPSDPANWCVGIAVSPARGRFYWTQKGASKSGTGRIFSARIATPADADPAARADASCILSGLPEPIDLELDEAHGRLYWTDRGELPWGNALCRVDLDTDGFPIGADRPARAFVIARRFHEAIGLRVDEQRGRVYVSDLGGGVYECDLEGRGKRTIWQDEERALTGLALL